MKALKHKVLDMSGKEVGTVDLDPEVFGVKVRKGLMHQIVRWQRAKKRAGTHTTLNRAKIEGGSKKPWKQKGTGRARAGSSKSAIWVGGAIIHGPQQRSYEFKVPKKQRRAALASVLTDKLLNEKLVIVDKLEIEGGKTKGMRSVLKTLGVDETSASVVVGNRDVSAETGVRKSSKNLPNIDLVEACGANVYSMVNRDYLVATREGLESLVKRVKGETGASEE